ncbi:methyl-accepting chemotaxis protein [uncultured Methanofollis sp.]|uniref:methyl-accepting chemotaxis protein n=1 Tax=uncultured Methanofollis sp. TaxID=262500 RepID=UPI002622B51C|nr:methyl-accepting chemotaxis protein [uncultured Methanofollis sp.]
MPEKGPTIEECQKKITRLEKEIRKNETLAAGMDQIPLPAHIVDTEFHILYINRAAADLLGKKQEDCIGKPCYELYRTGLCRSKDCPCRVAMKDGQVNIITNDLGDGRVIKCTGVPYRDGSGTIIGAVEYFPDVTGEVRMIKDLLGVADGIRNGNLSVRAKLDGEGELPQIAKGVNEIIDAIIEPIPPTIAMIDKIGRGEIPEKITAEYKGDFKKLKESINRCVDELNALKEGNAVLQRAAQNDYTRKVEGHYEGIYAEMAAEINVVLDRLLHLQETAKNISRGDLKDLEGFKRIGRRSENDHIVPAFIAMMEAIQRLVDDANKLAAAGREGRLAMRADASKHAGEFAKVIGGVNDLLDAIHKPLDEGMQVAAALADGDYTKKFSGDIEVSGEFKRFKESLDQITVNGSGAFRQVKQATEQVQLGTLEASKGGDQIAKAAEQVALTSQRCADLGKRTLTKMEEITQKFSDLSASNEEIASTSQEVLERAQNVAEMGRGAENLGKEANTKITAVEKIASESVVNITQLNQEIHEIDKIVKLITDISNQTNLLALNAAIEAARAGEHGRGFAVVAGEVRNLAGESKKATNDIENLITSIQAKSEKTASNISSANTEISASVDSVNKAIVALNRIVEGAVSVTHDMGEIAKAIEDQANTSNAVVKIVEEGNSLTRSSLEQIEDLAALAEETSASTQEINSATHELHDLAGDLEKQMDRFKI